MTDRERAAITLAAQQHAAQSAEAQGLPRVITNPDVLRQVATLARAQEKAA
jgi:hypothetical protein